jgi:hypothetical protein
MLKASYTLYYIRHKRTYNASICFTARMVVVAVKQVTFTSFVKLYDGVCYSECS